MRFSVKQYEELILHMWRSTNLDPEQTNEVTEGKFVRFLREKKILTEKKQLDEMYRQCLYYKKGEEPSVGATVSFGLYM